jgi:hypothetical protein
MTWRPAAAGGYPQCVPSHCRHFDRSPQDYKLSICNFARYWQIIINAAKTASTAGALAR